MVCHGFKGFRRWGFFPWLGEELARAGWASAVLDFSHNGIGDEPTEFGRLDLFAQNTLTREMDDLGLVLEELDQRFGAGCPTALLGHSRAAVNVLTRAAEDPAIQAVVTWNGVSRALRVSQRQLDEWERKGRLEFTNARTGQVMWMDFGFVQDLHENADRFDVPKAVQRTSAAVLVIHARGDLVVTEQESIDIQSGVQGSERCQRLELPGSTHTLGAVHPFAGSTRALETARDQSLNWLDQHMSPAQGRKAD